MKWNLLFITLILIGCNVHEAVNGENGDPSADFFERSDNGNDGSYPNTPSNLTLNNSNLSDGGVDPTPPILVSGVANGETVKIFTDSGCSNQVGSATATSSTVVVEVSSGSKLTTTGTYTFYANSTINGTTSSCSSTSVSYSYSACPTGFIVVPMNSTYVNEDFCVAKYEMRNSSGAISQSSGTPQVSVTKSEATTNCTSLGSSYDLIANHQWQTIARDIEKTSSNWSTNTVGSGELNNGQYLSIGIACDSSIENLGASATTCSDTGSDHETKRTHTLSNGNIIWDFAGNVAEWVKDTKASSDFASGNTGLTRVYQITDSMPGTSFALGDGVTRNFKDQFGPANDYSTTLTSIPYGRLGGLDNITLTNNSMYRGGNFGSGAQFSGIFAISVTGDTSSFASLGYRCVFTK